MLNFLKLLSHFRFLRTFCPTLVGKVIVQFQAPDSHIRHPPFAMAEKSLRIISANGDEKKVFVLDTTTVREILQQFEEDDEQDRQATLLHGVTLLEPDMTVNQAGLKDGDDISLVWSDPFVEMDRWRHEEMDEELYVLVPSHITQIDDEAFSGCKALVKIVIPDSVTSINFEAFADCEALVKIVIPNSVTSIGLRAFQRCQFPDTSENPQLCDQHWEGGL